MYDHIRKAYINAFGMETLEDLQPDVDTDGKILLQRLEKPHFTEKLLEIAKEIFFGLLSQQYE